MSENMLTPEKIEQTIVSEQYHQFITTTVTVCCLTLANGFCVIGQSACADPENFDSEQGRKIARDDAKRKIWELEGYLLKERMFTEAVAKQFGSDSEFNVGDKVIYNDGTKCTVIGVYENSFEYEVKPEDGDSFFCHETHLKKQ